MSSRNLDFVTKVWSMVDFLILVNDFFTNLYTVVHTMSHLAMMFLMMALVVKLSVIFVCMCVMCLFIKG